MRKIKYKLKRKKVISKKIVFVIFILLLASISYGYSLLTTKLTITGTASGTMGTLFGDAKTTPGSDYEYIVGNKGWYALQAWGGNGRSKWNIECI